MEKQQVIPLWYEWGWLPAMLVLGWVAGAPDVVGAAGFGVGVGMILGENHAH